MPKLTLENVSVLRTFIVRDSQHFSQRVPAHYAQIHPTGGLELFRLVNNAAFVVGIYAPGQWSQIEADVPTPEALAVVDTLMTTQTTDAAADELVAKAIKLSVDDTFSKFTKN